MEKFFEMLGSGSPDEVPEGSDDDESVEEENSRWKIFKIIIRLILLPQGNQAFQNRG